MHTTIRMNCTIQLKETTSYLKYEPRHDKTNMMRLRPAWINPDQPAHPSSLIRIHAVRLQTL
jgi:hypothetical protein